MPVVISTSLTLAEALSVPLSHGVILWDDVSRRGTVAADSEQTGFEAENAADGLTWDHWRPDVLPARWEVQLSEAEEVDCAGLVHDLGTVTGRVKPQYHDGSSWVDLADELSPGTDRVLMFRFLPVIASRFAFLFDGDNSPAEMPSISIASFGKAMPMERGVTLDHTPITMSRRTTMQNNMSEGGQRLGLSIIREGVQGKIAFKYLSTSFMRASFDDFIEAARVYPFFFAWAPVDYPDEVGFLWLPPGKEDIRPEHADLPDRMHVAFEVEGVIE